MATTTSHVQMNTTAVTVTTTSETVLATSDTLTLAPTGGEGYRINGVLNVALGAGTTAVVVRVRQNSVTGSVVGAAVTTTATASTTVTIPFDVQDFAANNAPVANYVVTMVATGATANSTGNLTTIAVTPVTSAS